MTVKHKKFDAFLSHAKEDQEPIADKLYQVLTANGLKVYYSGSELAVGDSIEGSVDNGLKESRHGIVLLSKTYLAKKWTLREYKAMLALEDANEMQILPLRYKLSHKEVVKHRPGMADTFALASEKGIEQAAKQLVAVIKKEPFPKTTNAKREPSKYAYFWRVIGSLIPLFALTGILAYLGTINTTAGLDASISASKISLKIQEEGQVIQPVGATSITISNASLRLKPTGLFSVALAKAPDSSASSSTVSKLEIKSDIDLHFRELFLPANTQMDVSYDTDYIYLSLKTSGPDSEGNRIRGRLGSSGAMDLKIYPEITTSDPHKAIPFRVEAEQHKDNIRFESWGNLDVVLALVDTQLLGRNLLEKINGKNISFAEVDQTLPIRSLSSTIHKAKIQIRGKNLLGKSFPLSENDFDRETFLDFEDANEYHISASRVRKGFIEYTLSSSSATGLRTGFNPSELTSEFPTLLDLIISEPAKETIYTILAFLVTQFFLLKKILKKPEKKKKKKESEVHTESKAL